MRQHSERDAFVDPLAANAKTAKPRASLDNADTSPGVRGIPAAVKRAVCERDGDRCTFVSAAGKRCSESRRLEFHHVVPFALGGDRSADNIILLCRAHNAYMAEKDFGRDKMDGFRVREPEPTFVVPSPAPRESTKLGAGFG